LDVIDDYLALLADAPEEKLQLDDKLSAEGPDPTGEIPVTPE
jgi:hypothetical protein